MSGVGFLAAVKTFTPSARRRRRSEKQLQRLELPGADSSSSSTSQAPQPDVVPAWDTAPPITPPAAFLPANHKKRLAAEAAGEMGLSHHRRVKHPCCHGNSNTVLALHVDRTLTSVLT
ncbi:hypothetical protein C0J52_03971 [Blattella germanica]|nr:hypothetical protein C0J52_03971 [Blattella germanica]